ncbi:MAG TPA: glycosyltransferase family A protein [Flavobacteriaceae bacterium]|nr:glycosyltransferase family A protein [Flavobacteriaceae bacterium]
MRLGSNPMQQTKTRHDAYHRIIVPVFVPDLETEYFQNGLEVTKYCLESLVKTRHSKSFLTVVNNGSCKQVTAYLQELYDNKQLDQLVHYRENVGKIDAMLPIARTAEEPLITLTDGDVLFKQGWMQAVEEVYVNFPEAGMVSPVPHGTTFANFTVNTLFDAFFKGLLKFQNVCNPIDLMRFAESIGKEDTMYSKKSRLESQLTVNRKEASAVVGCGHFVATLRREVFDHAPKKWSHWAYASEADRKYVDKPNEVAGFWRLATTGNFAYHMGNSTTSWMQDVFENLEANTDRISKIPNASRNYISFGIKKVWVRAMMSQYFRKYFFKRWGLKTKLDEY